jgi:hypothetical protein
MGHSGRNTDKEAVAGHLPFPKVSRVRLPHEVAGAVEGIEPLPASAVEVVTSHLIGGNGYQMKIIRKPPRVLRPSL